MFEAHRIHESGVDKGGPGVVLQHHQHAGAHAPVGPRRWDGAAHHGVILIGRYHVQHLRVTDRIADFWCAGLKDACMATPLPCAF